MRQIGTIWQIGILTRRPCTFWSRMLGQKSCRTKVSRIFRIFVPNFAPNIAPNFSRIFRGFFVLCFVGDGDPKKFTKNPRHFQCKIPRQTRKNIHKILLESRQSNRMSHSWHFGTIKTRREFWGFGRKRAHCFYLVLRLQKMVLHWNSCINWLAVARAQDVTQSVQNVHGFWVRTPVCEMVSLARACTAKRLSPYSIQKRPEPQLCPKVVPAIAFGGSSQGDWNLSKIYQYMSGNYRFSKFEKVLTNFSPPYWNPQKAIAGTSFGQVWGSGVFECCKGEGFATSACTGGSWY